MRVRYLESAREDLFRAAAYYEAEHPGLAREFLRIVEDAVDTLLRMPEVGSPYEENTRRLVLPRFPYSLVYEVDADEILILAVTHHPRRPESWRDESSQE